MQHLLDDFRITVETLGLIEGSLVMLESGPFHPVQNLPDRLFRGALEISVFDAQNELAPVPACVEPGKKRRAQAADMQKTGGTWCKSSADGHRIE